MGRARMLNANLPPRMYQRGKQYVYLPKGQTKYVKLGLEIDEAIANYHKAIAGIPVAIIKPTKRRKTAPDFAYTPPPAAKPVKQEPREPRIRVFTEEQMLARRPMIAAHAAKRKARKLQASPQWADQTKIAEIYAMCDEITRRTKIAHHVDHIVPLQGKTVCGLHVEYNLQIITAKENIRKHNKVILSDIYHHNENIPNQTM